MHAVQEYVTAARFRLVLGWLVGILLGLVIVTSLDDMIHYDRPYDVDPLIERYSQLTPYLNDHQVVGYTSDARSWQLTIRSALVQYMLVPILVNTNDPHCCELVIGDFESAVPSEEFTVVHDFGQGLYLLNGKASSR
jgi:hypothetical protein